MLNEALQYVDLGDYDSFVPSSLSADGTLDLNTLLKLSSDALRKQGIDSGVPFSPALAAATASGVALPSCTRGVRLAVRTINGEQMHVTL